jgi:hypothetical protein
VSGKRIWTAFAAASGLVGVSMAVAGYRSVGPYGRIGAQYIAKEMCSCVFVTGRKESGCRQEFEPDIQKFDVQVRRGATPDRGEVRTRLAIFEGRATYEKAYGCTLPE